MVQTNISRSKTIHIHSVPQKKTEATYWKDCLGFSFYADIRTQRSLECVGKV